MELLFVTPGVELIIRLDGSENPVACNALLFADGIVHGRSGFDTRSSHAKDLEE